MMKSMMGGGGKVARVEKKAEKAMGKAVSASKKIAASKNTPMEARVREKADKAASKVAIIKDKLSTVKGKAMTKAVLNYADKASKAIKKAK